MAGVIAPVIGGAISAISSIGVGTAVGLVGTGLQVYSGYQQSKAEANRANMNARLASLQASQRAEQVREETLRRISTIRARTAAYGLSADSNSPLLLQQEQAAEGNKEASRIEQQGQFEVYKYQSEASAAKSNQLDILGGGILSATNQLIK